ncbi:MAG: hypothetical protein LC800_17315 [Acidobacteria bacterium]|nr:hypothetical protein [Acidobacteriota bacterium]
MRSSLVTHAVTAGATLLAIAAFAPAPAKVAGGCCAPVETPGAKIFDETGPEAREATPPAADTQPTPLDRGAGALAVGETYGDVFRALKDDNRCSRFFGGPRVAVTVFNEFARRIRRKIVGAGDVGLVMSGDYTTYRDGRSGASYRLFDEAAVNSNGPFFVVPPPSGARFQVGRFPAATRPAKALMLLHELGHLIRGPAGWLLPNDGGDAALSDRNTRTVESRCIEQLLALRE